MSSSVGWGLQCYQTSHVVVMVAAWWHPHIAEYITVLVISSHYGELHSELSVDRQKQINETHAH